MRIRAILLAIAGVSVVLLTMTRLGVSPVAPGPELGFRVTPAPDRGVLLVTSDAGDLNCWIRLTTSVASPALVFGAAFDNGTAVALDAQRRPEGRWDLFIHGPGLSSTEKFPWPAGIAIQIWADTPGASPTRTNLTIEDWTVFPEDKESDAAWKAKRRAWWSWASTAFLVLSLIGIIVREVWPEQKQGEPFSGQTCIAGMIDGLEGNDAKDTKRLRSLLSKVLVEGASLAEALGATGLPPTQSARLWFRARRLFLGRLENLLSILVNVKRDLE